MSGPVARASGLLLDARQLGYDLYQLLDWNVYLFTYSDGYSRLLLRFNEMCESTRLIYSILYLCLNINTLKGSICSNVNETQQMEQVIMSFLCNMPFQYAMYSSNIIARIESGKGIVCMLLCTKPYSISVIQPDMLVLRSLNSLTLNTNMGDLIALLGSIDFVLGSVDL